MKKYMMGKTYASDDLLFGTSPTKKSPLLHRQNYYSTKTNPTGTYGTHAKQKKKDKKTKGLYELLEAWHTQKQLNLSMNQYFHKDVLILLMNILREIDSFKAIYKNNSLQARFLLREYLADVLEENINCITVTKNPLASLSLDAELISNLQTLQQVTIDLEIPWLFEFLISKNPSKDVEQIAQQLLLLVNPIQMINYLQNETNTQLCLKNLGNLLQYAQNMLESGIKIVDADPSHVPLTEEDIKTLNSLQSLLLELREEQQKKQSELPTILTVDHSQTTAASPTISSSFSTCSFFRAGFVRSASALGSLGLGLIVNSGMEAMGATDLMRVTFGPLGAPILTCLWNNSLVFGIYKIVSAITSPDRSDFLNTCQNMPHYVRNNLHKIAIYLFWIFFVGCFLNSPATVLSDRPVGLALYHHMREWAQSHLDHSWADYPLIWTITAWDNLVGNGMFGTIQALIARLCHTPEEERLLNAPTTRTYRTGEAEITASASMTL
ncbi:MAG: hypothetical protein A3F41_03650 [Coxiella sp. RIFCSPHIGHO2_12_FULL_44_14]|nr:MAG: hypothetical protein A3F41_03650 [Coxiella sp. RIFCSPHIGHO2_12_FULL_44_14]